MRTFKVLTAAAAIAALAGGAASAQQASSDNGTDANGPITILKNMQAEPGGVEVDVNGGEVDDLSAVAYDDITTSVHKGANTLLVRWSGPITKLNFTVAYAATRNAFKNVAVVQMNASKDGALRKAGSRTMTFTIPG
jgi:ABC-type glycerol-3-phosphate transport system substrate-binding protein